MTISEFFRNYLTNNKPHCNDGKCIECKAYDMRAFSAYRVEAFKSNGITLDNMDSPEKAASVGAILARKSYMTTYRKSNGAGTWGKKTDMDALKAAMRKEIEAEMATSK